MFGEHIIVIVGDKDQADAWFNRNYKITLFGKNDFIDGCFGTYENKARLERHRLIWLRKFTWTAHEMGLLIHELSHCVNAVLKDVGFNFSSDSEEAYTTYLQRLSTEAFWKMRKLRK